MVRGIEIRDKTHFLKKGVDKKMKNIKLLKFTRTCIAAAAVFVSITILTGCGTQKQTAAVPEIAEDITANELEKRAGKTSFDSYEEIIGLLEGDEAYAFVNIMGYDGQVLLITEHTFDNWDGNMASIEATPYTIKADGKVTADSPLVTGGTANPLAIDDRGLIYCASHRIMAKMCYGVNGDLDKELMNLEYVCIEEFDDAGNAKKVGGFICTENQIVNNPGTEIAGDDLEAFDRMYEDYGNAKVIGFTTKKSFLTSWDQDASSLKTIRAYVEDVTNEKSENFIPAERRIAVTDMDGTLYGEKAPIYVDWLLFAHRVLDDPSYQASEDLVETGKRIRLAGETGEIPEDLELAHAYGAAKAFAGMTVEEYSDYALDFLKTEAEDFENLTYADSWYKPMVELVDYLNANDFTVYICSGTDRYLCRTMAENHVNILPEHIIGMDVFVEASGQKGEDGLEYVYDLDDKVVRTDEMLIKNVKANKVSQIVQEIGKQPVISLGNSSGDTSMAVYVTNNNEYKSLACMVVADDTGREHGDKEKAEKLRQIWDSYGWVSISMQDDWTTIYGDHVKSTKK